MAKARENIRCFNIFLLKKSVTDYEEALRDPTLEPLHLREGMDFAGQLYMDSKHHTDPEWLKFLRTGVAKKIDAFSSNSLSAALFLTTAKRIFVIVFGQGRHLLLPTAYERRFGLRVVVNRVAKDGIGTLELKKFEDVVVKRREEMSRDTTLPRFGVNIRQDMLRAVSGVPNALTLDGLPAKAVERIRGCDSLVVFARITFKQLGKLCRGALKASEDSVYKQHGWKWIDNLTPVTDPGLKVTLDQKLIDALKARRLSGIELTLPEEIAADTLTGLRFTGSNDLFPPQLDVTQWFGTIQNDLANLTPQHLRRQLVKLYGEESETPTSDVSVYDCLNFEPGGEEGTRFLLANGEWFEVSVSYDKEISDYIEKISATNAVLPDANADETEPAYIGRVTSPGVLDCLHTKKFLVDGDEIEVCDLISPTGHIIHVKAWSRSATFSHLLSQGAVSAETLSIKSVYRKSVYDHMVNEQIAVSKMFADDAFSPRNLEVVFGLIRGRQQQLPFFSRLNLMRNGERIERLGYKVGYKRIHQPNA